MPLPPRLEVSGDHRQETGFVARLFVRRGAREEIGADLGVPADVVAGTHLILEKAGEEQTLRTSGLHQMTVIGKRGVHDELLEDDAEVFRRGHLEFDAYGDLRVVRQYAGVVQQFLSIDPALRNVLQAHDEELECATFVYGEQFSERLHVTSRLCPCIAGLVPAHRLYRAGALSLHTSAHAGGSPKILEISSETDAYVPVSASNTPNSASTIAVAPHTRAPSTSKYGTFITPWGGIVRRRSSQATAPGSSNRETGSAISRSTSCAASVKAGLCPATPTTGCRR